MNRAVRVRHSPIVALLCVVMLATGLATRADERTPQPEAAAVQDFQRRLQTYLELQRSLAHSQQALTATANPDLLARRQAALAAAIRKARSGAAPGDVIPVPIARYIQAVVREDLARRAANREHVLFSDVSRAPQPAVNRAYPHDAALATIPPLLLMRLPRLPDHLQYRFYGRHLLLLDGDALIIVDYIPNVLPPV